MAKSSKDDKIKQRADGRYVRTVTDPRTGKRVYIYGKTEREIRKKLLTYTQKAASSRTFKDVADEWWETAERELAKQSVRTYNQALNRALEEFADTTITDISAIDIDRFLKRVASKGFAQKTVSNQKLVLNQIFKHAILENDIPYNPCVSVSIPKNLPKTTRNAAPPEEEALVLKTAEVWLFPTVAALTGMRKGEILALQWRDIDFDKNIINVSKSVGHDGNTPFVKSTKNGESRVVPLLNPLKEALLAVKSRPLNDYIISNDGKSPLTNKRYTTLMNNYRKSTGATCRAHELRHSFATIAFESGLPPKTVQELLGHKQLSTTMDIYTEFRKKSLDGATETLNNNFASSQSVVNTPKVIDK